MGANKAIYLSTLGCRLNEAELAQWRRGFFSAGHRVVDCPEDADAVVVNSCAVTSSATRKSKRLIRKIHRTSPSAHLVVTGCFASLQPNMAAQMLGVDLVIDNQDKDQLVNRVLCHLDAGLSPTAGAEPHAVPMYRQCKTRAFVKVQDGCRNQCTFCIVTIARGQERSRTIDSIVSEVQSLNEAGYNEVVLTGVHLGGYGSDINSSLPELIQTLLSHTSIPRIRLGSLEPWDLSADFFTLWDNPRLCAHLHLPLQSGCDATLHRMARRCSTDEYEKLTSIARDTIPTLNITTDLIVGFPGESEDEFAQTHAFIQRIGFGHIHLFSYSPREGTPAYRMRGAVPKDITRDRSMTLRATADTMKQHRLLQEVGKIHRVLWERPTQLLDRYIWKGYTANYLPTTTTTPRDVEINNQITTVQIKGINDTFQLCGESPAQN